MDVLQVNSVCGIGSTGRILVDLCEALESNGHNCLIAYGRGRKVNKYNAIKISTKLEVYSHVIYVRIFDKSGFGPTIGTYKLIKLIEKYRPNIIHLHNLHGYYLNVEVLFNYLRKRNLPVIWTLHDCWSFTGHCTHFERIGCDKWKSLCYNCPQQREYPSSLLIDNSQYNYLKKKNIFNSINNLTIVTPSEWLAGKVRNSYLNKFKVVTIYNGINLDVFKPRKGYFRNKYHVGNKFIVLGVANIWTKNKGFNDFLELSKNFNTHYIIVLVGLTEQQLKILPKNIIGITRTQDINELIEIYSDADVFVNPTYEDTFPTTNIESLACGTPVLTYDTGGSVEIITSSCGSVTTKKNPNSLYKAIEKLVKMNFHFQNCIERASKFSKRNMCKNYIKLYKNIYKTNNEMYKT